MNCKPGDLAIVVGNAPLSADVRPHLGRVVRCVVPSPNPVSSAPGWKIEPALGGYDHILDSLLRPIRPGDISAEDVRELYAPKLPEVA